MKFCYIFINFYIILLIFLCEINGDTSIVQDEVNRFKNYIQRNVNTCNDIYKYSCGKYTKNVQEYYDGYIKSVSEILNGKFNKQIQNILIENLSNETRNSYERQAIRFYKICRENIRNKTKIREQLNDFVKSLNTESGWPIWQDTWNYQNFDLFKILGKMRLYNFSPIIDVEILPYLQNTTINNIFIKCSPKIGYDHIKDYNDKTYINNYEEDLKHIFLDYGVRYNDAKQYSNEIIEFEKGIQRILTDTMNYDDSNKLEIYNYQRFKTEFWGVDWDKYFEKSFGYYHMNNSYLLTVEGRRILKRIIDYILNTSKHVIANFLLVSISTDTYDLVNPFDKPNYCIEKTLDTMNPIISYMYLHKYFNVKYEIDILDMLQNIKLAHLQIWNSFNVNDDVILDIKNKLDKMRIVFFSDHIDYIEKISQTYITIEFDRWNFIKTYYRLIKHNNLIDIPKDYISYKIAFSGKIKEPIYIREKNAIIIPPSIMQLPYYNLKWPNVFKYSKLGFLLSHAISKGFDNKGRLLDEYGNRHNNWWITKYEISLQIEQNLMQHYNLLNYDNIKINSKNSLLDNWADYFGIYGAYKAYHNKLLLRNYFDPIETLPRTGLSMNQTFFISYAQLFCEEPYEIGVDDEYKLPGVIRVIGTLSFMEEFRSSFHCN